jgi:soluble lytic murein transglycosylase
MFEIIKNTENEALITEMAKHLTYRDVYFVDNLFPILNIINIENPNSNLVHSIIRQESGFKISAESRVGATGFMQLMPATAREVSRQLGLSYNERFLKTNPAYNITLGSHYISSLINRFNGSRLLAIASYNAGATPVNRWIDTHGDPRRMNNVRDIVNWIELIGYSETRNYVQRVMEGSVVYEYILERLGQTTEDTNEENV